MIEWKREASQRTGYRGALIGGEIYKIVKYHYIGKQAVTSDTEGAKPGYHAYFKPSGWKNWGNSVARQNGYFATIEDAKAACEAHLKEHGAKSHEHDRIHVNNTIEAK